MSYGYGEAVFGTAVFGERPLTEGEAIRTTRYRFCSVLRIEFNVPYNWGIRIEREIKTSYRYKSLVPFVASLPYKFTFFTSNLKTISYCYGGTIAKEFVLPYSFLGYISRIRRIRYEFTSLTSIYKGTVRKITITATPRGQVARIELERR